MAPGTSFAFLMSDADPDRATRFMAVLGPHAMGLWQTGDHERFSTTHHNEPRHFHAVRLRSDIEKYQSGKRELSTYSKVFSTGYQILDDQIEELIEELLAREREGKGLWKRGERVVLSGNRGGDSNLWIWTVWDAGHVH